MLENPVIQSMLVDHLTLGDLFRLRRALAGAEAWSGEVPKMLVRSRMQLSRLKKPMETMSTVSERMRLPSRRCMECGASTNCIPRVCHACAEDPHSYRSLCHRRDVRAAYMKVPLPRPKGLLRMLQSNLRIVKVGPAGSHLFWRADVKRIFEHFSLQDQTNDGS